LASLSLADNLGADIYGVYTESLDGTAWSNGANNAGNIDAVSMWASPSGPAEISNGTPGALDGAKFYRSPGNVNTFLIHFISAGVYSSTRDASAYYGGQLIFYMRVDPSIDATQLTQLSGAMAGIKAGGSDRVAPISSLLSDSNLSSMNDFLDGEWKRMVFRLDSSNGLASADLQNTEGLFEFIELTNSPQVDLDYIFWKKQGVADPGFNISIVVKDVATLLPSASSSITWNTASSYKAVNAVADQFLELVVNNANLAGGNWCVQIYTDNKSSVTVSNPNYSGAITSMTVSGLVDVEDNSRMMPVMWRPIDVTLSTGSFADIITNPGTYWWDPWTDMKDISCFAAPQTANNLYKGHAQIKFITQNGFRWGAWNNSAQWSPLPADKTVRVFFLAHFQEARKGHHYKTKFVLEVFNE